MVTRGTTEVGSGDKSNLAGYTERQQLEERQERDATKAGGEMAVRYGTEVIRKTTRGIAAQERHRGAAERDTQSQNSLPWFFRWSVQIELDVSHRVKR